MATGIETWGRGELSCLYLYFIHWKPRKTSVTFRNGINNVSVMTKAREREKDRKRHQQLQY